MAASIADAASFMDAAAMEGVRTARTLKRVDTEVKAERCLKDNYKETEWDFESTHVRKVDGVSMFEKICNDIRRCREEGQEFHAGMFYNMANKETYKDQTPGVLEALDEHIDEAEELSPKLLKAAVATKRKPKPDHTLMQGFVNTCPKPNVTEWVGILTWAMQLKLKHDVQFCMILDCIRCMSRHKFNTEHPLVFALVKSWVSDVLVLAYSSQKPRIKPSAFLAGNEKLWPLVLQKALVEEIIGMSKTALEHNSDKVVTILAQSSLGMALFGPCFRELASTIYEDALELELDKLLPVGKPIDESAVIEAKLALQNFGEEHLVLPHVQACRVASYYYRGRKLKRRINSHAEDAALRVSFRWKTHAVEAKALLEFWIEPVLDFRALPKSIMKVCPQLCKSAMEARNATKEKADFQGELTGTVLKSLVATKSYQLLQVDPEYGVELAIISSVAGESSTSRLIELAKNCLPSATQHITPEQCIISLTKISCTNGFRLANSNGQSHVKYIMKLIGNLVSDTKPNFSSVGKDELLMDIVAQFKYFLAFEHPGGSAHQGTTARGDDALECMLAAAEAKKTAGPLVRGDIIKLETFDWLLKDPQVKRLDILLKSMDAKAVNKAIKRKNDVDDAATSEALAMFKKKTKKP
jgi:hypothetical protein